MVRKCICLICVICMTLALGVKARAAGEGQMEMILQPKVVQIAQPPRTADRPAPIIGAMGISLSAVILMVLADSRKK